MLTLGTISASLQYMTKQIFDSLGSTVFNLVVSKRLAHVAASKKVEELLDKCPCDRGCHCELKQDIFDAKTEEMKAYHELRGAEDAHLSYHSVRKGA